MTIMAAGAEAGLQRLQAVEIHQRGPRTGRPGSAAPTSRRGSPPFRLPQPPRTPPQCSSISWRSGMPIASSTTHGLVHVAGDLRTAWCRCCSGGRSRRTSAAPRRRMCRHDRDGLDVVDRGRAAVEAGAGRERRLQARLALLALEAFQQRRLFAADVGAGAVVRRRRRSPSRGRCSCRSAWRRRPG